CLGWLVAPGRLLVALPRQVFAQPALRILDEYLAQSTERAGLHHMPRLPDHRISLVGMRQPIQSATVGLGGGKRLHVSQRQCCRLLGKHMEAGTQSRLSNGRMQMVRRHDGQQLHALIHRASLLWRQQRLPGVITTPRFEMPNRTTAVVVARVAAEGTADQLDMAIEAHRLSVHLADERSVTATDHTLPILRPTG